ncbi:MAG: mandelate racemase/muconate lactonizing enzyme family protein [Chloroflexota bacterium]
MRITQLDVFEAQFPFRINFGHALASRSSSRSVFVRLESNDGKVGFGECVPRDYVTGETPESARIFIRDTLGPLFLGRSIEHFGQAPAFITDTLSSVDEIDLHGAAQCAVELAVLDLFGGAFNSSVLTLLGPTVRNSIVYSGVLPFLPPPLMLLGALLHRMYGVTSIKLKVGRSLDEDLLNLRILRYALGPDADVRVDANCGWTPEQAISVIRAMSQFRVSTVEQPVPKDDFIGLKAVSDAVAIPVMADESLCTLDDARRLAEAHAVDMFNVRISKCGGLLAAREVAQVAQQAGMFCQLGPHPGEGPLLTMAGRYFAATTPNLRYCEADIFDILRKQDYAAGRFRPGRGGRVRVRTSPGLGVQINEPNLTQYIVARDRLS